MTRIDAHQHFWRFDARDYGWISEEMRVLRRDFLPADLAPLLEQHALDGSIAVQARQSLAESRWLLELAQADPRIRGVVGWLDLCADDLADQLAEFATTDRFVGVRHIVQDEPDDDFVLRADFQRGVGRLAEHGLVYDVLVFPRQLSAANKLVARFPEQVFVLDHIAKPEIKAQVLQPWSDQLRELALLPNVFCKVSGLVTEAAWRTWQAADFTQFLDVVFEAFGPERLMYGSDWPVCLLAGDYAAVYGLLDDYASRLSQSERAGLFGSNAARIYGLST